MPTSSHHMFRRLIVSALAVAGSSAGLSFAPDAEARGWRRGGYFVGGVVVGAMIAPRVVYASPYYYPPAVVYAPPVTYVPPPVTYVSPAPVVVQQTAPAVQAAPSQPLSIEDRLRRLRSMCDQGLFTPGECQMRREQLLQEM